jgi:hypothetical protein
MAKEESLRHIRLKGYAKPEEYTSPGTGGGPKIMPRDRIAHGQFILSEISKVKDWYAKEKDTPLSEGLERDPVIYLEIQSEQNYKLANDRLDSSRNQFELRQTKLIESQSDRGQHKSVVMVTSTGLGKLEQMGNEYLRKDTPKSGNPSHNELFANISSISVASLESFWNELPGVPFPAENEEIWWEVWLRSSTNRNLEYEIGRAIAQIESVGGQISAKEIRFPEIVIRLVKASPKQLADSILKMDLLCELRKPRDTADFFTELNSLDREAWVESLRNRIEIAANEDSVAICLLDSGVNNKHVLLEDFLPDDRMDTINPSWGTFDSLGHGTPMAGLGLYGDLSNLFGSSEKITIFHQLESVKLLHSEESTIPEFYGPNTIQATGAAELFDPFRSRIFCMAVTATSDFNNGRPSSWSAAVDQICFGIGEEGEPRLFFLSAGNIRGESVSGYPDVNEASSIEDPSQSFNAVTVGAFTEKDLINESGYQHLSPLAVRNDLSPYSRTSMVWDSTWPIKPEIVMEGGNVTIEHGSVLHLDSLQLLSTDRDPLRRILSTFNATSSATAIAARMAAQIKTEYDDFWPETIRALMIHSAEWTDPMLNGIALSDLGGNQRRNILRKFGYGIPILAKALYTARNSLTLIVQEEIRPFKWEGKDKTNEMHFFELPWPKEALTQIGDSEVRLNVTLSYFIDPNPGERRYTSKFHYQSHGLRFSINNPYESQTEFKKRINAAARSDFKEKATTDSEKWILKTIRNSGSIHRDMWIGTAAELSEKNMLAIFPVNGWYRKRKKLDKIDAEVRYSLIVSIEAPGVDVDLYTPIMNQIDIGIQT